MTAQHHSLAATAVRLAVRFNFQIGADPRQVCIQGLVAAQVVFVSTREAQNIGLGKRDLIGQFASALEAFFHPHRVHRKRSVIGDIVRGAGVHKGIIDIKAGIGRHVEFPAQFTGIGHAERPDFTPRDGNLLRRQPAETRIAEICFRAGGQDGARSRAVQ